GPVGNAPFTVDGSVKPVTRPWSATLTNASWAHLGGHGGYVFPGGATLKALRENRSGRWRDINTGGSTDTVTRAYLTLWADHGQNPA
ncbi:lyase, partial [Streptomyces sp. SID8455]|nr:lyase [Streptomyces sp. SID8455]